MAYLFHLTVKKDHSKLVLFRDGAVCAEREWQESRDMGARLFESIEEMLKEASIGPADVSGFEIDSDLPDVFTSRRIAETVKKVYTFGVTQS